MRTGNKGVPTETGAKKGQERRRSKAKIINKKERVMLSEIEERECIIVNCNLEKEEDWTYIGEL